jgi:hypothetical protein
VAGISGAHHVLGIEGLLGDLRDAQGTVLLGTSGGEGGKSHHKEVKTGEGNHVHGQLAEIAVKLTRESETASGSANGSGHQMVEVTVGGGGELQGSEADIVQGFVIKREALIRVLHKLVNREGAVVGLNDSIRHLGRGDHRVCGHDTIGVLLSHLGDEEGSHTRSGTTTHGVGELESLEAVAGLGLLSDNIKNGVDQLGTLGVVSLGPVVTSTGLSEDEVIGAEQLSKGAGTDGVHGSGLEIHEDSSGNISATGGFVEVHVDSLQLKIGVSVVGSGWVNSVLVGDNFPELGTDLVTALAGLNVNNLSHLEIKGK